MTFEMSCMDDLNQRRTATKGYMACLIEVIEVRRLDLECSNGNIIPTHSRKSEKV